MLREGGQMRAKKDAGGKPASFLNRKLLFDDFQQLHGASLGTDAAGDALGGIFYIVSLDHNMERASVLAGTATGAELLIDGVNSLGVLGDGAVGAGSCALAALDTYHRLSLALEFNDLEGSLVLVEFLVEGLGASLNTLQASHALNIFFCGELFHNELPLMVNKYFFIDYNEEEQINQCISLKSRKILRNQQFTSR